MKQHLKNAREALADAVSRLVWRWPGLEGGYVALGRALWKAPLVGRLYTRSVERLCDRLRASGRQFRRVRIESLAFDFDVSEFTMRDYYFVGALNEAQTTQYLIANVKPGHVVVDIGANHGYYTVMAALLSGPSGRIYAFEPNPSVLAQLVQHLSLNGLDGRVEIAECALSDENRQAVEFFLPADGTFNTGAASLVRDWDPRELLGDPTATDRTPIDRKRTILVETQTFDRWRQTTRLDTIDFMKIDVERAEDRVLGGMSQTLATAPPARIVCETHWRGPVHERLLGYGYHAEPLDWIVPEFGNILFIHRSVGD